MIDKERLALLQDGLRYIKGFVGVLDRWIELQNGRAPNQLWKYPNNRKEDESLGR
jgi:hypothetical protein